MDPWNNTSTSNGQWKTYSNSNAVNMEDFNASDECKDTTGYIEDKSFKLRLQELGDSTTLHGVRFLTNPKYHGLRRWVKKVYVSISHKLLTLFSNISDGFCEYFSYATVGLKNSNYTLQITILCEIWGNFLKNRYFANNFLIKVRIREFFCIHATHVTVIIFQTTNFVSTKSIFS